MSRVRAYLPGAVLLVGCVMSFGSRAQQTTPLTGPLESILDSLPGYEVREIRVSEAEQRVAGMTEYVARSYRRDSAIAFTTLVSYYDRQTQGKTIHSPKNCLPGAGWEIMTGGTRDLPVAGVSQRVNRYVLKNGPGTAVAYYWYQGRGRVTANEYRVKWNLLRDAALTGRTEEALVRVVVPVTRGSLDANAALAAADQTAEAIVARLMSAVDGVLPGRSSD
jgi:EpsI family protein